mmetsp:Transcript_17786/g.67146  ORF Transcript_17786/g.67146 Transcript_17786/m.67146 type:complete len:220 (+) Transcript_17786:375-1034(+)
MTISPLRNLRLAKRPQPWMSDLRARTRSARGSRSRPCSRLDTCAALSASLGPAVLPSRCSGETCGPEAEKSASGPDARFPAGWQRFVEPMPAIDQGGSTTSSVSASSVATARASASDTAPDRRPAAKSHSRFSGKLRIPSATASSWKPKNHPGPSLLNAERDVAEAKKLMAGASAARDTTASCTACKVHPDTLWRLVGRPGASSSHSTTNQGRSTLAPA